jgi:hypothetical protein
MFRRHPQTGAEPRPLEFQIGPHELKLVAHLSGHPFPFQSHALQAAVGLRCQL